MNIIAETASAHCHDASGDDADARRSTLVYLVRSCACHSPAVSVLSGSDAVATKRLENWGDVYCICVTVESIAGDANELRDAIFDDILALKQPSAVWPRPPALGLSNKRGRYSRTRADRCDTLPSFKEFLGGRFCVQEGSLNSYIIQLPDKHLLLPLFSCLLGCGIVQSLLLTTCP